MKIVPHLLSYEPPLARHSHSLLCSTNTLYSVCGESNEQHEQSVYKVEVHGLIGQHRQDRQSGLDRQSGHHRQSGLDRQSGHHRQHHRNHANGSAVEVMLQGEVPLARKAHQCVALGHNKWILFGGFNLSMGALDDVWVLDLEMNHWKRLKCHGMIPGCVYKHSAVVCDDEFVSFGGIGSGAMDRVYILNLSMKRWEKLQTKNAISYRFDHSGVLYDQKMIVFGGMGMNNEIYNDVWEFDIPSRRWRRLETKDNPNPRYGHGSCIQGDFLYVFGGKPKDDKLYQLDLKNLQWKTIEWIGKTGPKNVYRPSMVTFEDKLIIHGGFCDYEAVSDLWMVDLKGSTERSRNSLNSMKNSYANHKEEKNTFNGLKTGYWKQMNDLIDQDLGENSPVNHKTIPPSNSTPDNIIQRSTYSKNGHLKQAEERNQYRSPRQSPPHRQIKHYEKANENDSLSTYSDGASSHENVNEANGFKNEEINGFGEASIHEYRLNGRTEDFGKEQSRRKDSGNYKNAKDESTENDSSNTPYQEIKTPHSSFIDINTLRQRWYGHKKQTASNNAFTPNLNETPVDISQRIETTIYHESTKIDSESDLNETDTNFVLDQSFEDLEVKENHSVTSIDLNENRSETMQDPYVQKLLQKFEEQSEMYQKSISTLMNRLDETTKRQELMKKLLEDRNISLDSHHNVHMKTHDLAKVQHKVQYDSDDAKEKLMMQPIQLTKTHPTHTLKSLTKSALENSIWRTRSLNQTTDLSLDTSQLIDLFGEERRNYILSPTRQTNAARVQKDHPNLINEILTLDDNIPIDVLQKLERILPSESEAIDLKSAHPDILAPSDAFMRDLIAIPRLSQRLKTWVYKRNSFPKIDSVKDQVTSICNSIDLLLNHQKWLDFLKIILKVSNALQGAYLEALHLEDLLSITEIKSKDAKVSLLEFVYEQVCSKHPHLQDLDIEVGKKIKKMQHIDFKKLFQEIQELISGYDDLIVEIDVMKNLESILDDRDCFISVMDRYSLLIGDDVQELRTHYDDITVGMSDLGKAYGLEEKQLDNPTAFFSKIITVLDRFHEAARKVCEKHGIARESIDISEKEPIEADKSSISGDEDENPPDFSHGHSPKRSHSSYTPNYIHDETSEHVGISKKPHQRSVIPSFEPSPKSPKSFHWPLDRRISIQSQDSLVQETNRLKESLQRHQSENDHQQKIQTESLHRYQHLKSQFDREKLKHQSLAKGLSKTESSSHSCSSDDQSMIVEVPSSKQNSQNHSSVDGQDETDSSQAKQNENRPLSHLYSNEPSEYGFSDVRSEISLPHDIAHVRSIRLSNEQRLEKIKQLNEDEKKTDSSIFPRKFPEIVRQSSFSSTSSKSRRRRREWLSPTMDSKKKDNSSSLDREEHNSPDSKQSDSVTSNRSIKSLTEVSTDPEKPALSRSPATSSSKSSTTSKSSTSKSSPTSKSSRVNSSPSSEEPTLEKESISDVPTKRKSFPFNRVKPASKLLVHDAKSLNTSPMSYQSGANETPNKRTPSKHESPHDQSNHHSSNHQTPDFHHSPKPPRSNGEFYCMGLHDFQAEHDDELSFQEGDMLRFIEAVDSEWWRFEFNGQTGIAPRSYVDDPEQLQQNE